MAETDADAVLHAYYNEALNCAKDENYYYTNKNHLPQIYDANQIRAAHDWWKSDNGGPYKCHLPIEDDCKTNGHISVSKRLFEIEKYDTDPEWRRMEDSEYVRRIVDKGYDVVYTPLVLTNYRHELSVER